MEYIEKHITFSITQNINLDNKNYKIKFGNIGNCKIIAWSLYTQRTKLTQNATIKLKNKILELMNYE